MSESVFSPTWYRVAELKPRIRGHAEIHRHEYRGDVWYVLQDHVSGRSHRFNPAAHYVIGLMDGERTVQSIWEAATEILQDDAPTQDDVIRLLGQLHASDVMQCDIAPDSLEILKRYERHAQMRWKRRFWSPLSIRIPVLDPDRFLTFWLPFVRPLFGWFGFVAWLAVVVSGCVLAVSHWPDITENVIDRVMAPQNLLLLWLVYPLVKAIHELGHGFATKVWGGEVHDMGIMFLVFMPVPYVDASSASAFREKHRRMIVGAAGIMVELFLAAVALLVWLNVEPGMVRSIAYNVMLVGGVSTLLFNGNPLLRFDGYYVLADALEIPNLGGRANQYFGYLIKRYLFGVKDAKTPVSAAGEKGWFFFYGAAAFVYRMFIMFVIVTFVAGKFFFVGVLLAIWAAVTQLVLPSVKLIGKAINDPTIRRKRLRSVSVSALALVSTVALVFVLPVPLWARAEGVIWVPEQSQVRSGTDGFVQRLLVADGAKVAKGEPLLVADAPLLKARESLLAARVNELRARLNAESTIDRVRAEMTKDELAAARADLSRARERLGELIVKSPAAGILVVPEAQHLPGRFVRQGQVLAYITDSSAPTVRVCVLQDDIGLMRERLRGVEAQMADWQARPVPARIARFVPAGTFRLPTRALGSAGGGQVPVDPNDPEGLRALERVFELEVVMLETPPASHIGRRVLVRFDYGTEPLGWQWYRSLRQLLLRRFNV